MEIHGLDGFDLGFSEIECFHRADRICDAYEREWLAGRSPRVEDYLGLVPAGERADLRRELELLAGDYTDQHRAPRRGSVLAVGNSLAGRYSLRKLLGEGAFGRVYLAYDEQLDRLVAVKVPHAGRVFRPEDAEEYLTEARTVASLDHPHIVPVHDVGSMDEFPCYVVSKYIDGTDLSTKIKENRPSNTEAAELVATVAEALHYAHKQGLVHRDVKPANILIGKNGQPHVVDFGLALQEESVGKRARYAGTPAYMSPEQARGEGHRVDGRSDIFSLGIVFFELLVGRRPFLGESRHEVLAQITTREAPPPRQIDSRISEELERICLKALSTRATDRYTTAKDFADELRDYLRSVSSGVSTKSTRPQSSSFGSKTQMIRETPQATADFESQPVKIVPKGLRSFDAHDADFFLELLPGPRDRDGLPDSLRFWKTRIEETDPDNTFSVGLIYGPCGCGKSSLVKAGLLPRLPLDVIPIYIEATPEETETRLLHGLRKRCAALEDNLSLKDTLAALRRGQGIPVGKKVLIVLDQFEQWLHAKKEEANSDLVQALRQCDGGRVQCIVMVRDDFWMAVTRFLRELEIRLLEGHNLAAVDLFPARHAQKVLAAFGRAFGAVPDDIGQTSKEQKAFLKQSVAGLAEDGKVVSVRLALFAEMMKDKAWTPATLQEVGGTTGIGVTFLEETFSSSTASPEHRYHQKAARRVLKALLPETGTDIKGEMKSHDELLDASGYARRPQEFDDLIRILDGEIRLITPTDPEVVQIDSCSASPTEAGGKYFQLTHDYLVPSLREWLTRKQKETPRGRAELLLADRATVWNARPENRQLPSLCQWLQIRWLSEKKNWTSQQRRMMGKAGRHHAMRVAALAVLLAAVVFGGTTVRNSMLQRQRDAEAARLVEGLLDADTSQVKMIIGKLTGYRQWAKEDLRKAFTELPEDSNARLHAALAMLPEDESVLPFLKMRLLTASPTQFEPVRKTLEDHKSQLVPDYWNFATDGSQAPARRFQAACALASYDPDNDHWQDKEFAGFVARHLVGVLPSELAPWRNALRPVKEHLTAPLAAIYRDGSEDAEVRGFATDTLADYLSDDAQGLFDLLADANAKQFERVFDKLGNYRERVIALGNAEVARTPVRDVSEADKEALAMRKTNAAVMLLRMDAAQNVWPLLKHSPDPRVRSYFIHWLSPRGGDPNTIIARYEQETDVTIMRALLLCLGEFDESRLPESQRTPLIETLLAVYRTHSDAGLHAAAEWLLWKWGQGKQIASIDRELQQNEEQLKADNDRKRQWYLNSQGQTFVVLDAGEFQMGSPDSEEGRSSNEQLHRRKIGRQFAISTKQVTWAQWRVFAESQQGNVGTVDEQQLNTYVRTDDSPIIGMTWYEAAWYCNWLSEQEGIPKKQWCYETNDKGQYGPGMKAEKDFWTLTGYRLPTEAEWEFACRAGAATSRYYGVAESLLPNYAWYLPNGDNHTWPGASLKPNDFGLFDMQGSSMEWVYDAYSGYPSGSKDAAADAPNTDAVSETTSRVLRCGSFSYPASLVRSAQRFSFVPTSRNNDIGFRPCRTYNRSP